MWRDYQRGIMPSREPVGRGGQNWFLLEAFAALDAAEARSNETLRQEMERKRLAAQKR